MALTTTAPELLSLNGPCIDINIRRFRATALDDNRLLVKETLVGRAAGCDFAQNDRLAVKRNEAHHEFILTLTFRHTYISGGGDGHSDGQVSMQRSLYLP